MFIITVKKTVDFILILETLIANFNYIIYIRDINNVWGNTINFQYFILPYNLISTEKLKKSYYHNYIILNLYYILLVSERVSSSSLIFNSGKNNLVAVI